MYTSPGVLNLVAAQLGTDVARSGFALSDSVNHVEERAPDGDQPANDAIQLVGYRRVRQGEPVLLLELCHILAEALITGALWRPDDLVACDPRASVETVARFYRTWRYDDTIALGSLASDVVNEVRHWLAHVDDADATVARPPTAELEQFPVVPEPAEERTRE